MNNSVERYDAIVIGFGKGGKTLAATLGAAGKRTALIEKSPEMYGGTCINVGCIPTKFLVHKSQQARLESNYMSKQEIYSKAINEKNGLVSKLRKKNFEKLKNTPNVTIINGTGKLRSDHEVEIFDGNDTLVLYGEQIFLNTGAISVVPDIPGLKENPYVYTSEGLLNLEVLPEKLVIIGGGYIGVEFASIYADFGSTVTIVQDTKEFLPREDEDIASAVLENLQSRGVQVITDAKIKSISTNNDKAMINLVLNAEESSLEADAVLVATGRRPNTLNLGLENAGIITDERGGVVTDEHLRTNIPWIYAMGDVLGKLQFTYISLDDFRVVRSAVLGDGSYTTEKRGVIPYSVFLNPPFSRVGMSEKEAIKNNYNIKVSSMPAAAIPKAHVLEQTSGLLKVIIDGDTERILGAHLFCESSHEIINLIKLAIDANLPYTMLRDMIYTHPTICESFNDLFKL